jgi:hypothetical protein
VAACPEGGVILCGEIFHSGPMAPERKKKILRFGKFFLEKLQASVDSAFTCEAPGRKMSAGSLET